MDTHDGTFPFGFLWGVGSSAYKIEGAWNEDGKGESVWDRYCHLRPGDIVDRSSSDVACDSYHLYKQDVQLVKQLGAKVYHFSISWSRILPKGTTEVINAPGVQYYSNLIDELLANEIEPMITLFQWDLPQCLHDMGGWTNEELVEAFADYARVCFENFGDRVSRWLTFDAPYILCMHGYDTGKHAPSVKDPTTEPYIIVHNMLKAHAEVYALYSSEFRPTQNGRIGIAVDSQWYEPADPKSPHDRKASERALQFRTGWVLHPLFKGNYPPLMREIIASRSAMEGRSTSRLPLLNREWIQKIRGSIDFLGINYFTTNMVQLTPNPTTWGSDMQVQRYQDPNWRTSATAWLRSVPWGLRKVLNWVKDEYGNPEVIITENGVSDDGELEDTGRSQYHQAHIEQVWKAKMLDGCNVNGYIARSLLDGFEDCVGYTEKFGLFHVDFTKPQRPRTPKASVQVLRKIYKTNEINVMENPNSALPILKLNGDSQWV